LALHEVERGRSFLSKGYAGASATIRRPAKLNQSLTGATSGPSNHDSRMAPSMSGRGMLDGSGGRMKDDMGRR
jgi:hypothetical protein